MEPTESGRLTATRVTPGQHGVSDYEDNLQPEPSPEAGGDGSERRQSASASSDELGSGAGAPVISESGWSDEFEIEAAPEPLSAHLGSDPEIETALLPRSRSRARSRAPARVERSEKPRAAGLRVALSLFLLTFLSAIAVHLTLALEPSSLRELMLAVYENPALLRPALIYALALMSILLAHDVGHLLTSLACRVRQSYPYYIPFPLVVGTLGSVIFLQSKITSRTSLLRIGVMGPFVGLLAAIPIAAYGLSLSTPIDLNDIPGGSKWLGNSLLFLGLANVFSPQGIEVQLHPLAYAGWVGMFVTSLNLIPAAQLDGGHVVGALFGRAATLISTIVVLGLLAYGVYLTLEPRYGAWAGAPWLIWATMLFVVGIAHPRVHNPKQKLGVGEWLAGGLAAALLIVTFVPVPVQIVPADPADAAFIDPEPDRDWSVEEEQGEPESFEL
ncbi:MAG: site-2 protease family protein [Myxococcota bacterium]